MWKTDTLEKLCNIEYGTRVTRKKEQGTIYPVYGGGGETFRIDKKNRNNSVVISRFGMSERCTRFVHGDFFLNDSGLTLSPKNNDLSQNFLNKIIFSLNDNIFSIGRGTAQKNLDMEAFKKLTISYPPLAEQQRIVAKLDAAFSKIEEAINNIKLKDTKLDQFKLTTLSDTFKDNNWDNIRLGDCIFYEKKNSKGSSLPYVGMENISSGSMELIGEITVPKKPKSSFYFNNSHVLFGRLRPYLRKVLVPDFEGQCSNEIFCIKPKANVVREFLAYWLLEQNISSKIEATSTGTRMPRANMNSLLEFNFPTPSIDEQKKIISKLNLIFTNIDRAKKALAKSKENYLALKSAILDQELQSSEVA